MDLESFKASIEEKGEPDSALNVPQQALWWAGKGNWDRAHDLCQPSGKQLDRIHAYLHRVEGDDGNAGYWYSRAGTAPYRGTTEEEWADLVRDEFDG